VDFFGGMGGQCLFIFFTFVHILLVALFFFSFFIQNILMKQIQDNQNLIGKSIPAYGF
jgi:hypothetical protein